MFTWTSSKVAVSLATLPRLIFLSSFWKNELRRLWRMLMLTEDDDNNNARDLDTSPPYRRRWQQWCQKVMTTPLPSLTWTPLPPLPSLPPLLPVATGSLNLTAKNKMINTQLQTLNMYHHIRQKILTICPISTRKGSPSISFNLFPPSPPRFWFPFPTCQQHHELQFPKKEVKPKLLLKIGFILVNSGLFNQYC